MLVLNEFTIELLSFAQHILEYYEHDLFCEKLRLVATAISTYCDSNRCYCSNFLLDFHVT